MFENLEELRYPFENLIQFLVGGYWYKLEALHLTLGWVFIFVFLYRLSRRPPPLSLYFSILFFALAIFTNPAFDILGLKINEWFGILAVLVSIGARKKIKLTAARPIALGLGLVFCVGVFHNLLLSLFYPALNVGDGVIFVRAGVNLKIAVLALNLLIIGHYLSRENLLALVIQSLVNVGTFALLMYILQGAILVGLGVYPYGTYIDAGFIGIPSFGSVSIERGHLGKFIAPLFPFFLYALLAWHWRLRFALFVLISCINFSASGQAFFVAFSLIALWYFRGLLKSTGAAVGFGLLTSSISIVALTFPEAYFGVVQKIYQIAILGDESSGGGRSFGVFLQYLESYPFGIGYSGSSLRTPLGMEQINSGYYAFFAQFFIFSIPILTGYIFLVMKTLRVACTNDLLSKAMSIGVLGSALIFAADILWFIPTIWLSFEVIWAIKRKSINTVDIAKTKQVANLTGI